MQQSHVILGLEQQFEEAFSQESQRGISSLIEEINNHLDQNDQLTSYSTESRKGSENNIVKKNYIRIKRDKEKQIKFYEVVFEYFGVTKEKIKYNYGKSKNYISKKEIASMVEKRQKQLEEQKKQMKQEEEIKKKEEMKKKEEIKNVEEPKKVEQAKKNIIKGEISNNNKNYKTLIIPSLFVRSIPNGNLVSQIYLNLFELNQFQLNFNINNNYNYWNNNFNA